MHAHAARRGNPALPVCITVTEIPNPVDGAGEAVRVKRAGLAAVTAPSPMIDTVGTTVRRVLLAAFVAEELGTRL